jgi:eukaryotic-like serine/threonine-protein kinase
MVFTPTPPPPEGAPSVRPPSDETSMMIAFSLAADDPGTPGTPTGAIPPPRPTRSLGTIPVHGAPAGKYEVKGVVGEGGMSRVLRVRDNDLRRDVAMKVLGKSLRTDEYVKMFCAEAQLSGHLEHPNVLPVHELGVNEEGEPYFTMKLLDQAETLADIVVKLRAADPAAHARFTFDRRVQLVQQLCHVLEHAHARGVVHRDLKPSNVLVGPHGEVYLVDWGIALAGKPGGLDEEGYVVGTPAYMSPEQARGEAVDARSDVYSLTVVLYELLTLHHYLGATEEDADVGLEAARKLLARVQHEEPKLAEAWVDPVAGRVPRMLSVICSRGLSKDPAHRFQSARELEAALQSWQEGCGEIVCPGTALQRGMSKGIRWIDRHPFAAPMLAYVVIGLLLMGNIAWLMQFLRQL